MLLLSTDRTSGALGPVLGSPAQNKHRHTEDQQQATNMVRIEAPVIKGWLRELELSSLQKRCFNRDFIMCINTL